jgi:hypothetical protein
MSYPSNRYPRDREHSHFEDDDLDRDRGIEGSGRSHMSESGRASRERRPGEREPERFGERRYSDPYSGRNIGRDAPREYSPRQSGYAPYPYGEEPPYRHLEDWQQPWQLGDTPAERSGYPREYYGSRYGRDPQPERRYESRYTGRGGQSGGMYRGRGPKGYQRSDERLREDICERLMDAPDIDATEITLEVASGEVTLTGSVHDRHMKRCAEDIVEEVSGVKQVHNGLRIEPRADRTAGDENRYESSTDRFTRH